MVSRKFGLLLNDEIDGLLYEAHGGYQRFFYDLLNTDTDPVTITVYDVVNNELPRNPFEQEGWIVGGSRSSITAVEPWMLKLFDFLQDLDDHKAPTVGVCFGHQALAHALGGEVQRKHSWGLGSKPTQIHLKEPWMTPQMNAPVITFCHEDEVVGLPDKSKLIGSAENCAIAMFTKEDHIFSMQPHPEFSNVFARDLYNDWRQSFDPSALETANDSLNSPSDRQIIGSWIKEFFSHPRA